METVSTKLTKTEWTSVEVPVSDAEKRILGLIQEGYWNPEIKIQPYYTSMILLLKMEVVTPDIELYVFQTYFASLCASIAQVHQLPSLLGETKSSKTSKMPKTQTPKISKTDLLRLSNMGKPETLDRHRSKIFEYQLLDILNVSSSLDLNPVLVSQQLYTISHLPLPSVTIPRINPHVLDFVSRWKQGILDRGSSLSNGIQDIFRNAVFCIEKNPHLGKFQDLALYEHQKQLFTTFRRDLGLDLNLATVLPKLVLYTAPTGTGKTLSPLGLAEQYRVIYICAARHVGLALAKSAISMGKAVAFAFGCETTSDIRLHYFAAAEYSKNQKSGGIGRVDNSNGSKVQMMICDVRSYLVAMYYMLNFHSIQEMVLYWDEPTIGLDVPTHSHPLHAIIVDLWQKNKIPQIVLSCATLPSEAAMEPFLTDFRARFSQVSPISPQILYLTGTDEEACFRKSIRILGPDGRVVMPHTMTTQYTELVQMATYVTKEAPILMRYLDIASIVEFLSLVADCSEDPWTVSTYFTTLEELTMMRIKRYYLNVLEHLEEPVWIRVRGLLEGGGGGGPPGPSSSSSTLLEKHTSAESGRCMGGTNITTLGKPLTRMASCAVVVNTRVLASASTAAAASKGVCLTTADAHTLTDGPTIYLAEDVDKLGKFFLQQSRIPPEVLRRLQEKLDTNTAHQEKLAVVQKQLEDSLGKEILKERKMEREGLTNVSSRRLHQEVEEIRGRLATLKLDPVYVPNTRPHQMLWVPPGTSTDTGIVENAFTPTLEESQVRSIMELTEAQDGVDTQQKLLLLLGIGVFRPSTISSTSTSTSAAYTEIMKTLAQEQRLFLILASSDYIYGTNYQFCHAFLGKDLETMTPQKMLQAMGRVGRGQLQQDYTVRFRDVGLIQRLFGLQGGVSVNWEATNFNILLRSGTEDLQSEVSPAGEASLPVSDGEDK